MHSPTKLRTHQRNYTPQRNLGVTLGSETIRNRQYGADYQTSRKEMTRVLKPFDLQALSIFLCIKVALVTEPDSENGQAGGADRLDAAGDRPFRGWSAEPV